MKPDERLLLAACLARCRVQWEEREAAEWPRDVAGDLGVHPKRAHYLFCKWTEQGFYEYGVNAGLGWFIQSASPEIASCPTPPRPTP